MADLISDREIWKQIDLSESYMVCCMFEDAASLAASVIREIRTTTEMKASDYSQLAEMMESAGMVLIQSLKELARTAELFSELKILFGTVAAIPVQVFLTGACLQISDGSSANLRIIFEEFLEKWVYLKNEVNVLPKPELQSSFLDGCPWQSAIPVEKYLEVADVYAITILGTVLHKPDVAISWTERTGLPEEKRLAMLRRLHSLTLAASSSSGTISTAEASDGLSIAAAGPAGSKGRSRKATELQNHPSRDELKPASVHPSIWHISDRRVWLKFGNFQLVLPRGKYMFLASSLLFLFYIIRRKHAVLKRILLQQASDVKRALFDAWQLAFSVQVNPLAAVQQVPSITPRGSR